MGDTIHIYETPAGEELDSEFYVAVIEHILVDDPDADSWYTSYDLRNFTGDFLTNAQATQIANTLRAAESAVSYSNTQFIGAVVKPWQKMTPLEEVAYMMSVPYSSAFGALNESTEIEVEMDRMLVFGKRPSSGRRGRLELRNALNVTDLVQTDHLAALDPGGDWAASVEGTLEILNAFETVIEMSVVLGMIGRVQLSKNRESAPAGEKQTVRHFMSAPVARTILDWTVKGLGKRQVHNS